MGILVECPKCKIRGSVKHKVCKCGNQVQKSDSKNYWIDYYINGKRTRERIGRSKQAAEVDALGNLSNASTGITNSGSMVVKWE